MLSCPPRLRRDLTYRHEQTAEGTSVIIKHPASRRFFRLEEAEYFIARQLDGETPIEAIRQRTQAEFDAELPLEDLYAFIQTLKKNGLLETADTLRKDASRKPKRFRGTPLYCRIQVCDPCELLKRLARCTSFFFTRAFVVFSAVTILLAVGMTAANWREFREDLPRLYHSSAVPAIILILFVVIVVHEFGHGLTCTHFGGEVHEMGFAMIFLQPAFYCNVSDAWLFPEKSKRLWVGFAGPYFELFLWALAVFTWRITEPETWINFVALSVMATSGVKTLVNFNPIIKLDGYYLLSDYLELPNLRRRSFRQVGSFLERLFGFGPEDEEKEKLSPRERRIFWFYGTIALAGSFSLLGYIIVGAGSTLLAGRTPTAVLLTLMLLFMKFRRRFRRMFGNPNGAAGSFDDMDFDTHDEDNEEDEPTLGEDAGYYDAADKSGPLHSPMALSDGHKSDTVIAMDTDKRPVPESEGNSDSASSKTSFDSLLDAMYGRRIRALRSKSAERGDWPREKENLETPQRVATTAAPPVPANGRRTDTPPAPKESKSLPAVPAVAETPREHQHIHSEGKERSEPEQDSKPKHHAEPEKKHHAKPEKRKSRRWQRMARRVVWLALAGAGAVALFYVRWEAQATGPLNILPVRNADVRTEIDGLVDEVLVKEGAIVHGGDLVARLSVRENKATLEQTDGQIQQLKAQLRLQVAGPTPDEIEVAKTAVVKARDSLNFARVKLDATKELFKNNLVARLELDTAEDLYATTKDDLVDAEGKLKVLLNGTRPEQIDQTKAQISSLQAQQRFLQGQIHRAEVRSPVDGIVATPELELKELVGQVVQKGALIAKVFELQKITVQIAVPENEIPDVQVGQKVVLKVRAYPDETFTGAVTSIATNAFAPTSSGENGLPLPTPTTSSGSSAPRTILVTTEINNHSLLLKPGMTGHAKISCGRRRLIDLIKRRLARTVKVQFWSWW
jgi:multidrug resistance efflux pump